MAQSGQSTLYWKTFSLSIFVWVSDNQVVQNCPPEKNTNGSYSLKALSLLYVHSITGLRPPCGFWATGACLYMIEVWLGLKCLWDDLLSVISPIKQAALEGQIHPVDAYMECPTVNAVCVCTLEAECRDGEWREAGAGFGALESIYAMPGASKGKIGGLSSNGLGRH